MLLGFLGYHTYLISRNMTTNEQMKQTQIYKFVEKKLSFIKKWMKAREEKKPFKPAAKSIEMYDVNGDIKGDLTDDDVKKVLEKVQSQHEILSAGSFFKKGNFIDALKRLWDPDTYDANGNPEEVVMERRGEALRKYE